MPFPYLTHSSTFLRKLRINIKHNIFAWKNITLKIPFSSFVYTTIRVNINLINYKYSVSDFSSLQSLSRVRLFATPWTAARQASLSINNFWSLPQLMSIESVMPSNHFILCRPLLLLPSIFPSITVFTMSQLFAWGGQSTGVSASVSVLQMNTKDWSPLGWTGWISLQSKGLSSVFSNTTVQKHQFFSTQFSL